jgi:hypothetical protein
MWVGQSIGFHPPEDVEDDEDVKKYKYEWESLKYWMWPAVNSAAMTAYDVRLLPSKLYRISSANILTRCLPLKYWGFTLILDFNDFHSNSAEAVVTET